MSENSGRLFIFLMDLAWRCRISLPALLTCSMALLGQACVLHINISTRTIREQQFEGDSSGDSSESDASSF
ncbi:uncharacterized protein LOC143911768 [Arctopsyche grandis]|uniref:uncharacterized protein LOC143911768 n=1 Tax=Arctopsyche grandis TaxID=121162 RepID=UPI00406D8A1B